MALYRMIRILLLPIGRRDLPAWGLKAVELSMLLVPVHVDALCLAEELDVSGPAADFTRLPYVDALTGRDVGSELPYLSEILLPAPFEDQGLRLKPGIHLHWALPDALTRLVQSAAGTETPLAPDRWLVTRSRGQELEGQWVVESDAVSDDYLAGVAYPVTAGDLPSPAGRPYRHLGRKVPLAAWDPSGRGTDRLPGLAVTGYGEPTFAAFYPNCHSVYGFHDPDHRGTPPEGTCYDVFGWYGDVGRDELARLLRKAGGPWQEAVAERLRWSVPPGAPRPQRMLCYGRITFAAAAAGAGPASTDDTGVYLGHTATEALAAHLGERMTGAEPDEMENLLEALAYADDLESATLDLSIRLAEARHTATFAPVSGGTLWTLRRGDQTNTIPARPRKNREPPAPPGGLIPPNDPTDPDPSEHLLALLNTLNEAQERYDAALRTLAGLRRRLYADWYKYMLCVYPPETGRDGYPDPDKVAFFLQRGVQSVEELTARAGSYPPKGPGGSYAHRLAEAYDAAGRAVAEANGTAAARYVLQEAPAPRYYLPSEPVVLFTGSAATPSDRYGEDGADDPAGLLACAVTDPAVPDALGTAAGLAALRAEVAAEQSVQGSGLRTYTGPSWHPVLMEWEVEFFPAAAGDNLDPGHRDYSPNFVTDNYVLAAEAVELLPRAGVATPDKAANVYSGRTILSGAARPVLSARVLGYLGGAVLTAYNDARTQADLPTVTFEELRSSPDGVLDWYDINGGDTQLKTLIRVYRHLAANQDSNLSQALGGFNDALLMLQLTRQLPVADPLGFPAEREFASRVAAAVGDENRHAPQPLSDFNPIRAGALRVRRLRMLDNFGAAHDVDVSALRTTTRLDVPGHPGWVAMPPRLAQPARIAVRLLDEGSSPVHGWVLADNLDDSLRFYSARGDWLGALYAAAQPGTGPDGPALWLPSPGGNGTSLEGIGDPHLRAVATWLRDRGAGRVGEFLTTLDDALATIEPETHAAHRGRAVLTGQPLAVLRADVGLRAMGPPAVHQDWNVFRQDMTRSGRETNAFGRVRFPLRIGEHGRLGDGMAGYWLEDSTGDLGDTFHDMPALTAAGAESPVLTAIDLPSLRLTLLADPRAAIHVTSGILPTEIVSIPAEHYQDAMRRLEVGLLAAPILSDMDRIALPLPAEPGAFWTWRQLTRTGWAETSSPPTLRRGAGFDDAAWAALTAAGWLTVVDDDTALITPAGQRPPLPDPLTPLRDQIVALLDQPGIEASRPDGPFPHRLTAREGWLALRALPDPSPDQGSD
ncbi:MAG: hypothetical protein JWO67_962 [Streptosporangiaceae bacterium]|nr:hypothetical protein [Streptosporangiaceae bacterium]